MLYYARVFLIVGLIADALGLFGRGCVLTWQKCWEEDASREKRRSQ